MLEGGRQARQIESILRPILEGRNEAPEDRKKPEFQVPKSCRGLLLFGVQASALFRVLAASAFGF
jgi:hypothetical protein